MDRPRPWLRFVEASDLGDTDIDFDGLPVRNAGNENLGESEGFIVDADNGRPYYVVVDAGGWFKSSPREFCRAGPKRSRGSGMRG